MEAIASFLVVLSILFVIIAFFGYAIKQEEKRISGENEINKLNK